MAIVGQLGEVERTLETLVEEVFTVYKETMQVDEEGNECITKE